MDDREAAAFRDAPTPLAVVAVSTDGIGEVLEVNRALCLLLGQDREEVIGTLLADHVHPEDERVARAGLDVIVNIFEPVQLRIVRQGWGVLWVALSATIAEDAATAVIALQDVTAWRQVEQKLAHRVAHDPLTGLANRVGLEDHLDRALARLSRRTGSVAVLFCDLDGFKTLNDTYGHRFGDAVLQDIARRIQSAVRREDFVVRMGGDEFIIVCETAESSAEAAMVAERVRDQLAEPLKVQGRQVMLSVSIGVAQVNEPPENAEDLIRRADLAMYRAKDSGRNRVEFFVSDLEQRARDQVEIAERLRDAITRGHITVDVQPVVSLADGAVRGHEALMRVRGDGRRTMLPHDFVDVAERTGMLGRMDTEVRRQALSWLSQQAAQAGPTGQQWISVNVSNRELAALDFTPRLQAMLQEADLSPDRLVLEVGEVSIVEATGPTLLTLQRLRRLGFHVLIDHFGAGYTSLTALRDLPVDMVKIDESFVENLEQSPEDEVIVQAIVEVARALDLTIVAQGVQTPTQAQILQRLGCHLGQGSLFGSPVRIGADPTAT